MHTKQSVFHWLCKFVFTFFFPLLGALVGLCAWQHSHYISVAHPLRGQGSRFADLYPVFCCPLALCCTTDIRWQFSVCRWDAVATGASPLPGSRLVSMMEELVWQFKWWLANGVSPQPVFPQATFHWAHFLCSAVWACTSKCKHKIIATDPFYVFLIIIHVISLLDILSLLWAAFKYICCIRRWFFGFFCYLYLSRFSVFLGNICQGLIGFPCNFPLSISSFP